MEESRFFEQNDSGQRLRSCRALGRSDLRQSGGGDTVRELSRHVAGLGWMDVKRISAPAVDEVDRRGRKEQTKRMRKFATEIRT